MERFLKQFRIMLGDKVLDVLAIQETKLINFNSDSEFFIHGFDLIRRDRIADGGGGVCFYVKASINVSVCNDLNIADLENLC